jgi:hypothetical protein
VEIVRHFGHHIVVARYGLPDEPVEYAVECEDCFEVICFEPVE